MKSTISLLVVICTVVLAAQQSQAKKGCQAYGHVCYGGHGKRSLDTGNGVGAGNAAAANAASLDQELVRSNGLLPMLLPNEQAPVMPDQVFDDYPSRQVLYKIMKSWFNRPHRPSPRLSDLDYPLSSSGETFNRDGALNALN